jgi:hypothetical protein
MFRIEGQGGAVGGESAVMTDEVAVASVRAHGIRALRVAVPLAAGGAAMSRVTVRVYSLAGRLVRVLLDEDVEPGSYVVGWDGLDQSGRPVLPGVYIAIMNAESYRGVQRLIIK